MLVNSQKLPFPITASKCFFQVSRISWIKFGVHGYGDNSLNARNPTTTTTKQNNGPLQCSTHSIIFFLRTLIFNPKKYNFFLGITTTTTTITTHYYSQ